MEKIKEIYKKLIEDLTNNSKNFKEKKLVMFAAAKGGNYFNLPSDKRIMIIGRALNGGKKENELNIDNLNSHTLCLDSLNKDIESDSLDWVKKQWGAKSNMELKQYNTKKSAFWRIANSVTSLLNKKNINEVNTDDIVWSNLYKAAKEKGNPSQRLQHQQFAICKEILDAEIEYYKPSFLIFLTGQHWVKEFLNNSEEIATGEKNKYVKKRGVYKNVRYVVGQHPQGKNEGLHVKELYDEIISL